MQVYWKKYYNKQLVDKNADMKMDSSSMPDLNMWVSDRFLTMTDQTTYVRSFCSQKPASNRYAVKAMATWDVSE